MSDADFTDELSSYGESHVPHWMFTYVRFMIKWVTPPVIILIMISSWLL